MKAIRDTLHTETPNPWQMVFWRERTAAWGSHLRGAILLRGGAGGSEYVDRRPGSNSVALLHQSIRKFL